MKTYSSFLVILLLLCQACQQNQIEERERLSKEKLATAISTFNTAFAKSDLTKLNAMTTDNYLHTNGASQVINKKDWFKYLNKRNAQLQSGQLEVLGYRFTEQKIEYYNGNTAIVTGKVTVRTKDRMGIKEKQFRVTTIWILEKDKWKRAGFHDGKIY